MLNPLNEFKDKKLMNHLKIYKGSTLSNFKKDVITAINNDLVY